MTGAGGPDGAAFEAIRAEHLLELAFVSDPRVAPGGNRIATVITRIVAGEEGEPPRYQPAIEVFGPGEPLRLPGPDFSQLRPRFSPDGGSVAFLASAGKEEPAQVHLVQVADLGSEVDEVAADSQTSGASRITDEPHGVAAFEWKPDGRALAFLARSEPREERPPVAREVHRLAHKLDGKGYLPAKPARLRLQVLGGEARDLRPARPLVEVEEFAWSPGGRYLYLAAAGEQAERDRMKRRLWRLEVETLELLELAPADYISALSPSPDGQKVAFLAPAEEDEGAGPSTLWVVDAAGGNLRRVGDLNADLGPATGGDSRHGEYPNRPHWLSANELLVNHNRAGVSNLAVMGLQSGELRPLTENDSVVTAFHRAGGTTALVVERSDRPGELCRLTGPGILDPVSDPNSALLRRLSFRPARGPFVPDESSGAAYWRVDPAEPRSDRAHVLQVHGGPHTNVGQGFYFEFQLLAARGFSVIYGNPRGSSSYGLGFATSILGNYGSVDADDLVGFVDHALTDSGAEDAPVHLTGGSYGGFMTNWLVAHSDRFRSAVTQRGICNFLSFYGTSDIGFWFTERELGGNPWDDFELLWRQSPLRLAHRISTPLLILHSEADLRCPVEQAQQLYTAVARTGRAKTRMTLFPEESHELSRSGRPDRRIRRLEEIVGWFESHA